MFRLIFNVFLVLYATISYADEPFLSNIQQLTTPAMGFSKAGEAYFSPDGRMISFQAVPEGEEDYQIFTLNLETGEFIRITHGMGACTCSFFRPDGKKLIYAASPIEAVHSVPEGKYKWDLTPYMNIYEADIDGSNPVALTSGSAYHAECAYSPDGTEIVFASNQDGSMNIYIMNSDGTNVRQITHTVGCYNGGPFFSPDGTKVIFRADREVPDYLQIYMVDVDGENLVQLTKNGAVNWAPFWHPSGDAVTYTTSIHGHYNYEIYLYSLLTEKHYRITDHPAFDGLPTFNRQGDKMLWTSKRGEDNTSQIFIADFTLPENEEKL